MFLTQEIAVLKIVPAILLGELSGRGPRHRVTNDDIAILTQ